MPDWQAFFDGTKTEIYPTDHLIRSVFVQKGKHTIRFVFHPVLFYLGIGVSLVSFFIILLLFFYQGKPGKRIRGRY